MEAQKKGVGGVDGEKVNAMKSRQKKGEEGRVGVRDAWCVCSLALHPA